MRPADADAHRTPDSGHAFALPARRLGRSAGSARQPRIPCQRAGGRTAGAAAGGPGPRAGRTGAGRRAVSDSLCRQRPGPCGRRAGDGPRLAGRHGTRGRGHLRQRLGATRRPGDRRHRAGLAGGGWATRRVASGGGRGRGDAGAAGVACPAGEHQPAVGEPGGGARPFARRTGRHARRWSGAGDPERSDTARRDVGDAGQGAGRGGQAAARSAGRRGRSDPGGAARAGHRTGAASGGDGSGGRRRRAARHRRPAGGSRRSH